jgi:hypothetical protein
MSKRMIDHLLADGAFKQDLRTRAFRPWDMAELVSPEGRPYLLDAEVYVLDTVTRHIYEDVPQEAWGVEDFPHCSPPGPVFWMETRAPRWMVNELGRRPWDGHYAWGALFVTEHIPAAIRDPDFPSRVHNSLHQVYAGACRAVQVACARHHYPLPDDEPVEGARAWFAAAPRDVQHAVEGLREAELARGTALDMLRDSTVAEMLQRVRWVYTVLPFFQMHKADPILCPGLIGTIMIDTEGRLVEVPARHGGRNIGHWFMPHGEYVTAQEQEQYMTIGRVSLYPMFLALSWMQEKATTLTTVDPCHQAGAKPPKRPCVRRHYTTLVRSGNEPGTDAANISSRP